MSKTGDVLKFLVKDGEPEYETGDEILCPVCEFNFNHVHGIKLLDGLDSGAAGWWGRGDLIVIRMECEEFHKWELCIGFHKGNQFIFARKGWSKRSKPD